MRRFMRSKLFVTGLVLLVVGSGPLFAIIVLAALGLWPDPDPNPIGPGLLAFFTFWPAVLCILGGVVRSNAARRRDER